MNNDLISREALKKAVGEQRKLKAYSVADERQNIIVDCILHIIDNAPTVPLPDFKEGYKQAILDGKTNFSRPKGKWIKTNDYVTCAYGCMNYVKCSCCKNDSLEEGDYCPNCGADMREVDDER